MKKIVVFASGNGSNFQRIVDFFEKDKEVEVVLLVSNKQDAYVLERAKKTKIPSLVITREMLYQTEDVVRMLEKIQPDLLVLAGFLWLIPENMIHAFPRKIINIHPALLPKYGGKGMYGMNVHKAVVENKEKETGISIHYVTKEYDKGDLICQVKCAVDSSDTPEDIAEKVHQLEYQYFPVVIDALLKE